MILLLIFLSFWLGLVSSSSYFVFVPLEIIFLIFIKLRFKRSKKLFLLCAFFILGGIGISHINVSTQRTEFNGIVVDTKENYYLFNSYGEEFYVYEKGNTKEIGDLLYLKGKQESIDFTVLESEFDFNKYLNNKGVFKKLNITYEEMVFNNPIRTKKVRNNFLALFDENTKDLYSSILFSNSINGELTTSLKNNGVSRLITLGGIYIYSFISIIEYFLEKKLSEKKAKIISTFILGFYSIFTFPRFTVIKILTIRIMRIINKYKFNSKFSNSSIIGLSGLLFLLLNVRLAKQDSFILGYLIPINNMFLNPIFLKKNSVKKRISRLIWLYFFFLPFELNYHNSTNFVSFFMQVVFSPIFIFSAFVGFLCFFKVPIYSLANMITHLISKVAELLNVISFSVNMPSFSSWIIVIYYFLYYGLIYYKQIKFFPVIKLLKIGYASLLITYILPIKNVISCEINFINVGQGDCCLIRDGNTTILIDTGGLTYKDLATSSLIPFFKSKRLYDIDLVVLTHDDYDHSGALSSLKANFKVKNVVNSSKYFPLKVKDFSLINYNNFIDEDSDENSKSLVIGFSLLNLNFLITGDAPIEIENKIMKNYANIPCDVLKIGHHGSNTSTSDKFIKYLNPKEAIISVGKNNKYGHPNDSVLKILSNNNVEVKRTDLLGTISYSNYKFL